jgi:DNA-binding winged helix-turn-helix (wHTH) protein
VRARFGPFTIDSETRQLVRDDREIHLSPKAFDLLCALIQQRPKVVDKAALHLRLWPNTYVVDANLNVLIGEIRRAIADEAQHPQFIRTAHGVGFAFSGEAVDVHEAPAPAGTLLCWLVWKERTFPLSEGDNVIGRDPRCSVWLDAPGVSRRHARIRIDAPNRRVALDDLGSTNGTFLGRSKVKGQVALDDGDAVKIGSVELKLRLWAPDSAPETKRIRRKMR